MASGYFGTRISPHIVKQPDGSLICVGAVIARSGIQPYKVSEVSRATGDDSIVEILRPVSEVCDPKALASFEGVPLTGVGHPWAFVKPENFKGIAGGHVQNVRLGQRDKDNNVTVLADLFVRDQQLIDAIERGVRDLSCGYTYSLVQLSNGSWAQTQIRGNHVAVVPSGRGGTTQIMDSEDDMDGKKIDRLCELLEKLLAQRGGSEPEESEDDFEEALNDSDEDADIREEYKKGAKKETPKAKNLGSELVPITKQGGIPVNPVAARDALQNLRSLRGLVEESRDRTAIDAYNRAIKLVKAQIRYESFAPAYAADSHSRCNDAASSFERSAARLHRKSIDPHDKGFYGLDDERTAADAEKPELTFDQAVAKARDEARARFTPKPRK